MANFEAVPAGNAVNHQVYSTILCIWVILFIWEKHRDHRYYFWLELALAHYANATQQFLKDEGISYIPKYNNPSVVASLRPIEDFRAALKKEKYGSRWEVEDFAQLKQRILAKFCLMCSNISSAQSVTESTNARKKDIWRSTDEHCL